MNDFWIAFSMAQSMFCALPVPCHVWKEEARRKMLLFLPVIGLEIGFFWVLADRVLGLFGIPHLIYGLVMCAVPYLATGFVHLDGFLDVTDAIGSWRPLEKRRAILKDSHVGSIAVVGCVLLFLAGFALFASAPAEANSWCLLLVPVISRCCSAAAVLRLPPMTTSQYAQGHEMVSPRCAWVLALICLCCIIGGFWLLGKYGFVLIGGLLGYVLALRHSYGLLEGMNGDISGYCLTISELCAVAVYTLL